MGAQTGSFCFFWSSAKPIVGVWDDATAPMILAMRVLYCMPSQALRLEGRASAQSSAVSPHSAEDCYDGGQIGDIMAKSQKTSVGRRGFLKSAAAGAAALATTAPIAEAQRENNTSAPTSAAGVPPPTQEQLAREAGNVRPPAAARLITRPGSDLMVQTIRDLGIEYAVANPGSSFEGLQESFINYGQPPNVMPEWITALHEESAVTMAHGYAKAEGKPMVAVLHGTIGIQHAAMSIYQAYYDRVPVVMIAGNDLDFIPAHTAHDMAGMVRSYTKWDAEPKTIDEALAAI